MMRDVINEGISKSTGNISLFIIVFIAGILLSLPCGVAAEVKMKTRLPELCYSCHKELKKGLSDRYVHFLFKQGKCISCHNSHVSRIKGLMISEIDQLCLGCHEGIDTSIKEGMIHTALRSSDCTECHFPHSGKNAHLLVDSEKELCLRCHEELALKLNEPYQCAPFTEGKCSACHDAHASEDSNLLVKEPGRLCKECHMPKCRAGNSSIVSLVAESDCTSCHSGHSSMKKGLLGPYGHTIFLEKKCEECHNAIDGKKPISTVADGEALCFGCHNRTKLKYAYVGDDVHVKDAANPCIVCHDYHASDNAILTKSESRLCSNCHEDTERRTAAMERVLKSETCEPIKERKCFECHIPSHSDRPFAFRAEDIPLCARCHAAQHKITHPLGDGVTDPRNGQPVTCNSCHSMHSSQTEFMLTHDRQRALCIQCHKM